MFRAGLYYLVSFTSSYRLWLFLLTFLAPGSSPLTTAIDTTGELFFFFFHFDEWHASLLLKLNGRSGIQWEKRWEHSQIRIHWKTTGMDRSLRNKKTKYEKFAAYKRAREGGTHVFKVGFRFHMLQSRNHAYDVSGRGRYHLRWGHGRSVQEHSQGTSATSDFVVDDGAGAGGYMDNGMDEWTDGNKDESEEEEIRKGIYSYRIHISGL